jgi:hypothetical protein
MAKVTLNQPARNNGSYSSERSYKWDPQDVFEITGQQFAALYHALNQEVIEKGGAPIQMKYEAYNVVMELLRRGIEQGVIVEANTSQVIASEVATGMKEVESKVKTLFDK